MPDLADLFPGYASEWINTSGGRIFARVGGKGPPLLLLHGFSSTHVMWHRVAPQLAARFTLIIADLPGYGWSDMPRSDDDHTPYTKRAMAKVMIEVMEQLGHVHFALAGHDRGGRVSYRLALDHPGRLSRLAVLDILPTYDYWSRINRLSALKIYHWAFLAQRSPLPETLISGNPDFFLKQKMASQTKSGTLDAIDPRALEHYLAPFRDPSRVHAMCEDYRAGAYADFDIDKADLDAGKKITIPMLALWGDAGVAASASTTQLDAWKAWATNVTGGPVSSGHFLPEEAPDETATALVSFFDGITLMALRDARRDEVARIVQLLADDQLGSTRENAEDITEYLRAFDAIVADPNNSLLVWEEGNMVAGCLQLTLIPGLSRGGSWRAQIESVRVASDHRGQRIGWKMMEAVIAMARARGCSLMQLTTDKQRIDAHRFYQRLGFVSSHEGMKLKL